MGSAHATQLQSVEIFQQEVDLAEFRSNRDAVQVHDVLRAGFDNRTMTEPAGASNCTSRGGAA